MKIATYNIASGGFDTYDSTADIPQRLQLLQEAIATIDADIIGLTDTFRWKDTFTAQQLQQTFEYPYACHINLEDTRVDERIGAALLSRYPIRTFETIRLHNRNALQVALQVNTRTVLRVIVLYLDDLSEKTRQQQAQALLEYIPNQEPVVVLGDFNALWPQHVSWVKEQVTGFMSEHSDFKNQPHYSALQATFDNLYQATVLPNLEQHGFLGPSSLLPTALTPLHPLGMPCIFPVDHILVKNCTATGYDVPITALFDKASDHYPLLANLELSQ